MPSGVSVEKETWAKRSENANSFEPSDAALKKRGVVWDPVSKLWVLEGEDEGDYFEKDPWAKRGEAENSFEPSGAALLDKCGPGVVWDLVLKLWVLEGDENEGDFFEKDPWGGRTEAENSYEPGAALDKRGVVWDPVIKLWVTKAIFSRGTHGQSKARLSVGNLRGMPSQNDELQ